MKNIHRGLALILCSLFLSGCAAMPLMSRESSVKDLYKRVPYKTEGSRRVITLFCASNQKLEGKGTPKAHFTPERSEEITYGTAEIKIDPRLKIGLVLPVGLEKEDIVKVRNVNALDDDAFFNELREAVENSPHKSLLIEVMGYKDSFKLTAIKAAYYSYLLDINTPMLLFSWPGNQSVSIGGYLKAQELAKASGPQLGEVIAEVIRRVKPEKLWIEGSSLGAQVVCDSFDYLYSQADLADAEEEIAHVILAAPDVAESEFDEKFAKEVETLSRNFTVYVSSDDDALLLSEIISNEKKLGLEKIKVNEKHMKHEQFDEMKNIVYLKSLDPSRYSVVDVTPINTSSFRHGYYLECPEYFDDVYLRLMDDPPHINRRLYLLKTKDEIDYWVLTSDK